MVLSSLISVFSIKKGANLHYIENIEAQEGLVFLSADSSGCSVEEPLFCPAQHPQLGRGMVQTTVGEGSAIQTG